MTPATEAQGMILPILGFALAITATPGPNNAMVVVSGASFGFRRTLPHILGVASGLALMLVAVALGAAGLLREWPQLDLALRWIGLAYLSWLAWRLARTEPAASMQGGPDGRSRPLGFVEAALFQWVNPKAWLAATGGVAAYGADAAATLAMVFFLVSLPVTAAWTAVGVATARMLRSRRAIRGFNLAMAALLVASLLPALLWR
jgi:threonine/homoserine/homoserine lactone efflux protein